MAASYQNVTLRLPTALLRRLKRLAAERETSISALLVAALDDAVGRDRRYDAAKLRALSLLRQPLNLGTHGRIPWSRDELHQR